MTITLTSDVRLFPYERYAIVAKQEGKEYWLHEPSGVFAEQDTATIYDTKPSDELLEAARKLTENIPGFGDVEAVPVTVSVTRKYDQNTST